jgi:hypothetical protein
VLVNRWLGAAVPSLGFGTPESLPHAAVNTAMTSKITDARRTLARIQIISVKSCTIAPQLVNPHCSESTNDFTPWMGDRPLEGGLVSIRA